jgi:hypothetical protein
VTAFLQFMMIQKSSNEAIEEETALEMSSTASDVALTRSTQFITAE